MLRKFKKLYFLFINAIKIKSLNNKENGIVGQDIYILGNGESVKKIDVVKFNMMLREGHHIAFCNGFLSNCPFELNNGFKCHYYISDPLIERFFDYILSGGDIGELGSVSLNKKLFSDTSPQAYRSLVFDALAFKKALYMEELSWHIPLNWVEKARLIGIKNIRIFNNYSFPCSGNILLKKLCIRSGFLPPIGINPLGPAVINMAIMESLYIGYDNIYVVGHSDEHTTRRFRIYEGCFEFSYKYFWDDREYWYKRDDTLDSFMDDQVDTIRVEKEIFTKFPGKIKYLSPHHLHLYFSCLEVPNVLK